MIVGIAKTISPQFGDFSKQCPLYKGYLKEYNCPISLVKKTVFLMNKYRKIGASDSSGAGLKAGKSLLAAAGVKIEAIFG